MNADKITRSDVDKLSAQILINLGIINAAALGASLAGADEFQTLPFAIGLIAAIFSQLLWYIDTALEHTFPEGVFSSSLSRGIASFVSAFCIIGAAFVSGASVVYGCFYIIGFSSQSSLLWTSILCGIPFISLFYIMIRKAF